MENTTNSDQTQTETPCNCHEQEHGSRIAPVVTTIIIVLVIAALVKFLFK